MELLLAIARFVHWQQDCNQNNNSNNMLVNILDELRAVRLGQIIIITGWSNRQKKPYKPFQIEHSSEKLGLLPIA